MTDELSSPFDGGAWCETCHGLRRVRDGRLAVDDPRFGQSMRCPDCTQEKPPENVVPLRKHRRKPKPEQGDEPKAEPEPGVLPWR